MSQDLPPLPSLPALDFSAVCPPAAPGALGGVSSAPAAAVPAGAPLEPQTARSFIPGYLPDGTPLHLTIDRVALYRELLSADGAEQMGRPASLSDALVLLFLCGNDPEVWNRPRAAADGGLLQPLRLVGWSMLEAIDAWSRAHLRANEAGDTLLLAQALWDWHHATEVIPVEQESQKKTAVLLSPCGPAGMTSGAGSSPAATFRGGPGCAAMPPSGMSIPPSTPITPPTVSRSRTSGKKRAPKLSTRTASRASKRK